MDHRGVIDTRCSRNIRPWSQSGVDYFRYETLDQRV
ncbi:hypothetical protein Y600_6013 [Burkholderia pseudomallei MSHR3709]|nr:hypothetical protein Y600_6013 [Burkholderia pseudomallei MSHR3709]